MLMWPRSRPRAAMMDRGDDKMRWKSAFILPAIAVGSALALAGCASQLVTASAALSRQQAMLTCLDRAEREAIRTGRTPRSDIYIDCMHQQGYEP